jgi:hypothetical protein
VRKRVENKDRQERPTRPLCVTCPQCSAQITKPTVKSDRGYYCICDGCGHMWHHDMEPQDRG